MMNQGRFVDSHDMTDLKLLELLVFLKMEQIVGRYRLKELLDMQQHEGIVRRMLKELSGKGWVRPTRSGCILTTAGRACIEESLRQKGIVDVKEVDLRRMKVGPKSIAVQVRERNCTHSLLFLRDAAVKAGAKGAVILVHGGGDLVVPSVYQSLMNRYPIVLDDLKERFSLLEGDMMVVGFAEAISKALAGALAIIVAMDRNETNI